MEFGADYPFEDTYPHKMTKKELAKYKGNFGISLDNMPVKEQMQNTSNLTDRALQTAENEFKNYLN